MKKLILIVCVALVFPGMAHAAGYIIGTYGFGGAMDGMSWGAELGGVFLSEYHPTGDAFSAGVGFSVGETEDDIPSTSNLPLPGPAEGSKKYNDGKEYEGYINLGAELIPALFGTVGVGYSSQKVVRVASLAGVNYETDSETETHITGMLGVRYVMQGFSAGIGFHSRRGVMLNLGVAF